MRFMMLLRHEENPAVPPQALMDAMDQYIGAMASSGTLVDTGGLRSSSVGARVRLQKGKLSVIDGPFTEAKEVIGGYAIVRAKSREEALAMASEFMDLHRIHWPGWEGESEVRQVYDPEDAIGS